MTNLNRVLQDVFTRKRWTKNGKRISGMMKLEEEVFELLSAIRQYLNNGTETSFSHVFSELMDVLGVITETPRRLEFTELKAWVKLQARQHDYKVCRRGHNLRFPVTDLFHYGSFIDRVSAMDHNCHQHQSLPAVDLAGNQSFTCSVCGRNFTRFLSVKDSSRPLGPEIQSGMGSTTLSDTVELAFRMAQAVSEGATEHKVDDPSNGGSNGTET